VFSAFSEPRLHNASPLAIERDRIEFGHPRGGGVEYLHRDPASRRRRRNGSLKSETLKYGHES
jgi:hypothetical protein